MVITVLLLASFAACQNPPPRTTVTTPLPPQTSQAPVQQPNIVSFEANPAEISSGQAATLTWNVSGAVRVEINQGVGTVSQSGSVQVRPTERTLYTIIAANSGGTISRTVEITVTSNLKAKPIALSEEEMMPLGFVFESNSEPSMQGTISTYYVKFLKGKLSTLMIDNLVYIFNTIAEAEKVFAEEKSINKTYMANYVLVGTQGYYLEIKGNPPEPSTYSIRFQKNNVYVKILSNLPFAEVESFAHIMEKRIK